VIEIKVKINSTEEAINLVKEADKIINDVDFTNGRVLVDAKSLLGVLATDFSQPCKLIILSDDLNSSINGFIDTIKNNIISVEVK
jgi:phosphotransferase system HPr-like phosphotransfer protein